MECEAKQTWQQCTRPHCPSHLAPSLYLKQMGWLSAVTLCQAALF